MTSEQLAQTRAEAFRTEHGLGSGPLGDLVTVIEQTVGVDVTVLDAGRDEHGMTMRDPERDVTIIAVARTDSPLRQRSTLAHELGHVIFGDMTVPRSTDWARRSPQEIRADAFARHLLVPRRGLLDVLGPRRPLDVNDLSWLVQRFLASPAIISIQLRDIGWIDDDHQRTWGVMTAPSLAARFGWLDLYRALQQESRARRAPQRLLARATEGYIAGVVSLEAVARLRGTTPAQVAAEFAEAGIVPDQGPVAWAELERPAAVDDFSDLDALDEADATGAADLS